MFMNRSNHEHLATFLSACLALLIVSVSSPARSDLPPVAVPAPPPPPSAASSAPAAVAPPPQPTPADGSTTKGAGDSVRTINVRFRNPYPDPHDRPSSSPAELMFDQVLTGDGLNKLVFPDTDGVSVRIWVPRYVGDSNICRKEEAGTYGHRSVAASMLVSLIQEQLKSDNGKPAVVDKKKFLAKLTELKDILGVAEWNYFLQIRPDEFQQRTPSALSPWFAQLAERFQEISEASKDTMALNHAEPDEQKILNKITDLASHKTTPTGAPEVTLPPLQYGITYCIAAWGKSDVTPEATPLVYGYRAMRVSWSLNSAKTWWADRYLSPSVGVAMPILPGLPSKSAYDSTPAPFVFVGAHITPWPTDRRIPKDERVQRLTVENFHLLVAAALMDAFPHMNTPKTLGASGLLLGAGMSIGDNLLAFSSGWLITRAKYGVTDQTFGTTTNITQTLFAPFFAISTQADLVAAIAAITK